MLGVVRTTKKIVGPPDPLEPVVLWTTAHKSLVKPCDEITSQGSDTLTSIFECNINSSNKITSLRLLKMAWFSYALEIFVSISCQHFMFFGLQVTFFTQLAV